MGQAHLCSSLLILRFLGEMGMTLIRNDQKMPMAASVGQQYQIFTVHDYKSER